MLVSGFILVINQTDVLMVGTLLSPREAGLYRAASKTATLVILVPTAMRVVVEPRLVELHAGGDIRELQRIAAMAARWSFIPALGLALVLAAVHVPVLRLFGSEFVAVRDVLLVLMGGQLLLAGTGVAGSLLNLTQFQRLAALIFGGAAALNIGLNALGIMLAGTIGAAFATATTLCILGLTLWWAVRRQMGVDASILDALRRRITSSTE
jgi:O-antigen/teichoic acid export membrane protein